MVRLHRTFSNLIFAVGIRCVGYLYTISEWFNHNEPPQTYSNLIFTVGTLVPCGSTTANPSNLLVPLQCRECKVCRMGGDEITLLMQLLRHSSSNGKPPQPFNEPQYMSKRWKSTWQWCERCMSIDENKALV